MSTFNSENKINLIEAAREFPGKPHASCVGRWCLKGCYGIRLEYVRVGPRIFTSREAMQRFMDALTAQDAQRQPRGNAPKPKLDRSNPRREREVTQARARLAAAGI